MKLNPPETAPKDKQFLGDFGFPWLVETIWNSVNNEWVYANIQASGDDESGIDYYYENEWEKEENLRGWIEIPTKDFLQKDCTHAESVQVVIQMLTNKYYELSKNESKNKHQMDQIRDCIGVTTTNLLD